MKHKRINILALGGLGLTGLLMMLLMYWSLVPFKPVLEIPDNKLNVVNKEVKAGDDLILNYHVCKRGNLTGLVTRYIEDNQVIALPDLYSRFPEGCATYNIPVTIPINTPTDMYTFHAQVTYKVSPIKTVTYDFYSDEFKVIGKLL
jgi:hypothetical protein